MHLYRAPWVIPVTSPPIQDGAVIVEDGIIIAVDQFSVLKGQALVTDLEDTILTPALINAHCHLELSSLAELGKEKSGTNDITIWIRKLLSLRAEKGDDDTIMDARIALNALHDSGVAAIVDIGNCTESAEIGEGGFPLIYFLLELLGLAAAGEQAVKERFSEVCCREDVKEAILSCTAHAPYSATPYLLKMLKDGARNNNQLFSIHVAESQDEIDFLASGTGNFRDFVEERGAWDGTFKPPGCGAITYLDRLGVIDSQTVCVHCVHLSEDEIQILASKNGKVCLCPGSNRNLGVGIAPVPEMLQHGILPSLGTDSLASNPVLNLWEEMRLLREDHPGLDPRTVFKMATLGGAEAIGCSDYGALAPGKVGKMLAVQCTAGKEQDVMDFMTSNGLGISVQWVR
jgi:cytosine/adenosine deaminase-related metal-dependent hydrolase